MNLLTIDLIGLLELKVGYVFGLRKAKVTWQWVGIYSKIWTCVWCLIENKYGNFSWFMETQIWFMVQFNGS